MAQPAPQPQQPPRDPQARAAAIVAALAAGAGAASATAGAAAALAALTKLLLSWGYNRRTVRWGARVFVRVKVARVRVRDVPREAPTGPAGEATGRAAAVFAAWFIEATTARVEAAIANGVDPDEAQAREARHLDAHLDAQERREQAAERVDAEAAKPGNALDASDRTILGWVAVDDDKVTPECAAADGCWFYADTPPLIGYPGMPHGGTCRCYPGPITAAAAARGRSVDEATRGLLRAEPDHRPYPKPDAASA